MPSVEWCCGGSLGTQSPPTTQGRGTHCRTRDSHCLNWSGIGLRFSLASGTSSADRNGSSSLGPGAGTAEGHRSTTRPLPLWGPNRSEARAGPREVRSQWPASWTSPELCALGPSVRAPVQQVRQSPADPSLPLGDCCLPGKPRPQVSVIHAHVQQGKRSTLSTFRMNKNH